MLHLSSNDLDGWVEHRKTIVKAGGIGDATRFDGLVSIPSQELGTWSIDLGVITSTCPGFLLRASNFRLQL
jgi:hypothetical protein